MDAEKLVKDDLLAFIGGTLTFFRFVPNQKFRGLINDIKIINDILIITFYCKEKDDGGTIAPTNIWAEVPAEKFEINLNDFKVTDLNDNEAALLSKELPIFLYFCAP
jgi:hypothetical protein